MRHTRRSWPNAKEWQSHRDAANAVMLQQEQQRSSARIFVRLPAQVTLKGGSEEHVAFVRDISPRGIFFFSDFAFSEGEKIGFVLDYRNVAAKMRLHLSGRVVRMERQSDQITFGIAVAFDSQVGEIPHLPTRPNMAR